MTLFRKQHSEHSEPPLARNRCRGQRGRTKRQRQRGFSYRQFAAVLQPDLLDKLPTVRTDTPLLPFFFGVKKPIHENHHHRVRYTLN